MEDNSSKVIKDYSEEFNHKITEIKNQIDSIKQLLMDDKIQIRNLNERLHAMFVHLSPKMEPAELTTQFKYKNNLNKIKVFSTKKIIDEYNEEVYQKFIIPKHYYKYRNLLELRELALNRVLERLGITAKQEDKKRKVMT